MKAQAQKKPQAAYRSAGFMDPDECVTRYAPLVKRIAHHMMANLPPSVEVDDIIQAGMMGLLDAAKRYEEAQGAQFETYAVQRIRGAMLDGLRQSDWLPRGLRKNMRRIEAAINKLQQKLKRPPSEQELADELGVGLGEYQHMLQDARGYQLVYYEDFKGTDDEPFLDRHCSADKNADPLESLLDEDMREMLIDAIGDLPEREQRVMALYYQEEMNLREIGEVMGVSESRVCQLHTQAISRLRARLRTR
ncbi:MAG TPA: RNA polymerase sigma factor FliA [Burkholderiales bacterium]|nr:RNA polymerase sigma factor FliA [Burkholderiales bacterium]